MIRNAPNFLIIATLITLLLVASSCGGGGMTTQQRQLTLQPASANIFTNYATGMYQGATLTAMFTDGTVPNSVQWKTTNACVAVDTQSTKSSNTVVCNFTCPGGTITATITASAGASTASSTVTCTWTN